jgi:hypothetical protein
MAKIDFFIVFLPFIELAWTMRRDPIFPDIGARVTFAGTTIGQYRSGFATNSPFDSTTPPRDRGASSPNDLKLEASMKALIHHNPACGTSRKTLEILRDSGADLTFNEYLNTPPSRD